jgi:glycosyltransferase involved in cell wall biosynthesis
MATRKRILLSTYYCHPNRGSEAGVGWNWLVELSKNNEIFCLFYSGEEQEEAVQKAVELLPQKNNIHLYPIGFSDFVERAIYYRVKYEFWLIKTFLIARRLVSQGALDLIHQVTISAWWFTGYYWVFNIPLILGPLLGGQVSPWAGISYLKMKYKLYEIVRYISLKITSRLFINSILSIRKAKVVIAGNNETFHFLSKIRKNKPLIILNASGISTYEENKKIILENALLRLLWVGKLIHVKNIGFLLECLETLPLKINWQLNIVGGGKLLNCWEEEAENRSIAKRIQFIGRIEHSEVVDYYMKSDIFLFTSLREGSPAVILEAMSFGLPVIAFKQNGADVMLDDDSGILIPIKNKKQILNDFVKAIVKLSENTSLRQSKGELAKKRIKENFLWEKRGIMMNKIYEQNTRK